MSTAIACVALLASLTLFGCSDNAPAPTAPGGGGPGSTTYSGTVSGSGVSGMLTLSIATSTPAPQPGPARARGTVAATGRLTLTGSSSAVNLTGTYDDVGNSITITGGGWTVTGSLNGYGMEGLVGGPGGETGVFSVQVAGLGANVVIIIVGDFVSTTGGPGGVFNFSIRGTVIHGNAFETGASFAIPLDGTYTPATGAISIVNPNAPGGPPFATGTLDANVDASGTYDNGLGEAGAWSGTEP